MFTLCEEDSTTRHSLARAPPPASGEKVDGLNVHGWHDALIRFSCQYRFRFFLFASKDNQLSFLSFFGACSTADDGIPPQKNRDQYPGRGWMFTLCEEDSTTRHSLARAPPPASGEKVDGLNVHGWHDALIRFSCQYRFRFFLFASKDNQLSFLSFFGACSTADDGIFSRAC